MTLVAPLHRPQRLAVDSTSVYFTDSDTIYKVLIDGGSAITLASGQTGALAIATDGAFVYWSNASDPAGAILSLPVAGGIPTTMAASQRFPSEIAINSSNIYWMNEVGGSIATMPLAGGQPITISTSTDTLSAMCVDSASIYWADATNTNGDLFKAPLSGGNVTVLGNWAQTGYAIALAAAGSNLYWAAHGPIYGLLAMPTGGGTPFTVASNTSTDPIRLTSDATFLYWTESGTGVFGTGAAIRKIPLAGGAPIDVALNQVSPSDIAVDSKAIYWLSDGTTGTNGAVLRLAK